MKCYRIWEEQLHAAIVLKPFLLIEYLDAALAQSPPKRHPQPFALSVAQRSRRASRRAPGSPPQESE